MKKFFAFAISALFVLGLAASAFAIHAEIPSETQSVVAKGTTQVTIGGDIRVRGETRQNTSDFDDDLGDRRNAWDQRVRLSVDAAVADNVQGLIQLEAGDGDNADTWTWGTGTTGAQNYARGNAKNGQFQVLQAWILYKTDVVGVKVGHMPLALGNNLFFDHRKFGDDAVVVFADPQEGVHVAALTAKFDEGPNMPASLSLADDADAYVALGTYTTEAFTVGGDLTWVHDKSFFIPGVGTADALNLYNIGLRGSAKVGPANIKADVEFQTGSVEIGALELDFGGMAVLVAGDMNVGGNTVGLEFGYGSGDDGTDIDEFITSLSSGVPYIGFVYGTRANSACDTGDNAGICNTTYVKAKAAVPLTEALKLDAAVIYLLASEDVALNGNATAADDLGIEIDAKVAYSLAKNLKYWVEGGYLLPGDAYNDAAGDADAAYALRHGIELSF